MPLQLAMMHSLIFRNSFFSKYKCMQKVAFFFKRKKRSIETNLLIPIVVFAERRKLSYFL